MTSNIQYNTAETLLSNVRADVNALMGGPEAEYATADGSSGSGGNSALKEVLGDLTKLLQKLIEALGGDEDSASGSGWSGGSSGPSSSEPDVISGSGRIWGDPHFIGADGGKYDVQGEAGKTYNLLSDKNFQMNGRFDDWGGGGATVVGKVGISAGSDQVEVNKDGSVLVNGRELADGERVELADGGFVEKNGKNVKLESGEWKVDFQIKSGGRNGAYINMDVSTDNAIADGVKPHGLLGQTFDGDGEARNGDKGRGAQGGGAIEGSDGDMTSRGDKSSVEMYEVDGLYDRNFTEFNQFFDDAESNPGEYDAELNEMMAKAFGMMAQSMFLMMSRMAGQQT